MKLKGSQAKRKPGRPKEAIAPPAPKKGQRSTEARARMSAAQKERWAKGEEGREIKPLGFAETPFHQPLFLD